MGKNENSPKISNNDMIMLGGPTCERRNQITVPPLYYRGQFWREMARKDQLASRSSGQKYSPLPNSKNDENTIVFAGPACDNRNKLQCHSKMPSPEGEGANMSINLMVNSAETMPPQE